MIVYTRSLNGVERGLVINETAHSYKVISSGICDEWSRHEFVWDKFECFDTIEAAAKYMVDKAKDELDRARSKFDVANKWAAKEAAEVAKLKVK
jgi:hypothetical protein